MKDNQISIADFRSMLSHAKFDYAWWFSIVERLPMPNWLRNRLSWRALRIAFGRNNWNRVMDFSDEAQRMIAYEIHERVRRAVIEEQKKQGVNT